jgi:hypothetical protein
MSCDKSILAGRCSAASLRLQFDTLQRSVEVKPLDIIFIMGVDFLDAQTQFLHDENQPQYPSMDCT